MGLDVIVGVGVSLIGNVGVGACMVVGVGAGLMDICVVEDALSE